MLRSTRSRLTPDQTPGYLAQRLQNVLDPANNRHLCLELKVQVRNDPDKQPVESVRFKTMIHKIHTGEELKTDFTIFGFGGTPNNFNEVRFPGDRANGRGLAVLRNRTSRLRGGEGDCPRILCAGPTVSADAGKHPVDRYQLRVELVLHVQSRPRTSRPSAFHQHRRSHEFPAALYNDVEVLRTPRDRQVV